jgi:NhaP-type Na+/H+ or K+/H+ antiporter
MNKIDSGRVVVGGIVAGIICDVFEYVLNGIVLRTQWNTISTTHNLPIIGTNEIVVFNILGLLTGIAAVWAYAAMRPRFGAGPKTATYAALLIWVVGYLIPDVFQTVSGLVPLNMTVTMVVVGLVEIIVATVAGAYLYKESSESLSPAVAR